MTDKLDAGPYWGNSNLPPPGVGVEESLFARIRELRVEVERLKHEVDYWMNLDAASLEAENERLRALNERQQVLVHQARDERDESDSENERLRAALEEHITSGHDHLGKLAAALESDKE